MLGPNSSGGLVYPVGHRIKMKHGYLDTLCDTSLGSGTARTLKSFGYEWTAFDQVRAEDEGFADNYFHDLDFDSLAGKVALDAGCGKGRYTRFIAPHAEALVALDGSSAVEAAARTLQQFPNVLVVKADLLRIPFARESFDFISCLGVLHHLEDPHRGFEQLVEYLAPEGLILLYLYSRPPRFGTRAAGLAVADMLRRVTVKMPHRVLRVIGAPLAVALYAGIVLPGRLGEERARRHLADLPLATYRRQPVRSLWLDTFDRLSAPIEHRYRWSDLEWWFTQAKLEVQSVRHEAGWFILARKRLVAG